MTAVKEHFAHHRRQMFGCGVASLILVTGIILSIPALAVVGGLACAAMCVSMIWMMIAPSRSH